MVKRRTALRTQPTKEKEMMKEKTMRIPVPHAVGICEECAKSALLER